MAAKDATHATIFHIDDHMLMIIGESEADTLPVAAALIKANN